MTVNFEPGEDFALQMDEKDVLKSFRERFYIPEGTIYMDGNSLGLMSRDAGASLERATKEWREKAINGWLDAQPPWFYLAETLGKMASELVGAEPASVVCTGTTTVNLHALVSTFYRPMNNRNKILADELNFPSDIYALQGQIKLKGLDPAEHLVLVPGREGRFLEEDDIVEAMTEEIALVMLPSVLYRSGQLLDIPYLTRKAHEKNILIGFDCSHSVGVVPHRFDEWGVDFAFWCGYKYMNGGPGSPGFLYVNRGHFQKEPLMAGWFGYRKDKQFDMVLDFHHAESAGGWQISTPCVLSTAPIEGSLKIFEEAGIQNIRDKSIQLTEYFIFLVDRLLPENDYQITVGTPRDPMRRSGHVALEGPESMWAVNSALKAKGIIPDYRPPGIIRFAPIALYNTFHEVWQTVNTIKNIIDTREYEKYAGQRSAIT